MSNFLMRQNAAQDMSFARYMNAGYNSVPYFEQFATVDVPNYGGLNPLPDLNIPSMGVNLIPNGKVTEATFACFYGALVCIKQGMPCYYATNNLSGSIVEYFLNTFGGLNPGPVAFYLSGVPTAAGKPFFVGTLGAYAAFVFPAGTTITVEHNDPNYIQVTPGLIVYGKYNDPTDHYATLYGCMNFWDGSQKFARLICDSGSASSNVLGLYCQPLAPSADIRLTSSGYANGRNGGVVDTLFSTIIPSAPVGDGYLNYYAQAYGLRLVPNTSGSVYSSPITVVES